MRTYTIHDAPCGCELEVPILIEGTPYGHAGVEVDDDGTSDPCPHGNVARLRDLPDSAIEAVYDDLAKGVYDDD